jgi:AcrR family transcriptional regulator
MLPTDEHADTPGAPAHAEAKELEERLREAAVAVFLEHGMTATMESVATLQASPSARSRRYPDKHALFVSVIAWALSRLEARCRCGIRQR